MRVTATNIRKRITDKAYELSPTKKRLIHGHMKHTERTADSNYVIRLNAERASQAHVLVQNIIKETPPTAAAKTQEPFLEQKEGKNDGAPLKTISGHVSRQEKDKKDATPLQVVSEPVDKKENDHSDDDLPLVIATKKRTKAVIESTDESDVDLGKEAMDTASV